MKTGWIIGAGGLLLLLFLMTITDGGIGMMDGYGRYGIMHVGMFFYGLLYLILITAVISVIFSIIFKGVWQADAENTEDAMSILKSRFAKGELSKEEYEEKKKIIENI